MPAPWWAKMDAERLPCRRHMEHARPKGVGSASVAPPQIHKTIDGPDPSRSRWRAEAERHRLRAGSPPEDLRAPARRGPVRTLGRGEPGSVASEDRSECSGPGRDLPSTDC